MRKRPLIVVEWDDICTDHGWELETAREVEPIRSLSVGWRIPSKSRKNIVITPMRSDINKCTDRQVIPRGCIRSIRKIE